MAHCTTSPIAPNLRNKIRNLMFNQNSIRLLTPFLGPFFQTQTTRPSSPPEAPLFYKTCAPDTLPPLDLASVFQKTAPPDLLPHRIPHQNGWVCKFSCANYTPPPPAIAVQHFQCSDAQRLVFKAVAASPLEILIFLCNHRIRVPRNIIRWRIQPIEARHGRYSFQPDVTGSFRLNKWL